MKALLITKLFISVSFFFLTILASNSVFSQQSTNCGGSSINGGDFSFEYSIGEIAVIPQYNNAANLSPGVTQPYPKLVSPSTDIINDPLVVFPNPSKNYVSVIGRYNWVDSYTIYSANGIRSQTGFYRNNRIDISSLPPGNYLIMLFPENTLSYKTIKIIKQ